MSNARLGGAATFIRGVTFDAAEVRDGPAPNLVPVLRAGNIGDTLDTSHDLVWVPARRASADQILRPGDIVIAMSSGSRRIVGKSAILEQDFVGSVGAFCGIVRPKEDVLPRYLAWVLRAPTFTAFRHEAAQGVAIQNLRFRDLAEFRFRLPSPDEQEALAADIEGRMRRIRSAAELVARRIGGLDQLRSRLIDSAFLNSQPLSVKPALPAPAGWRWRLLTDISRLESGHTPSRRRPDWWGGDVPWLALPDIRAKDGEVTFDTREHTNPDGIANSSARILPEGTVVLSRTASVGFVTRLGRAMATSQDFVSWVCGPELDPEFLMFVLIRSRDYIRSLASGATHKTVYVPTVKSFHVCLPPIAEQSRIAAKLRTQLSQLDAANAALAVQERALDALPVALLDRILGNGARAA